MTALGMLHLRRNQIDAKGCEALAPALAQMTALEHLDEWQRNRRERLRSWPRRWRGCRQYLQLDSEIGAKGCEALAPAQMTALGEPLDGNEIGAKGREALALLAQRTALKYLFE